MFSPLFAQTPPAPDPAKKDLARVAILKYEDLTEAAQFGYMPASLTEAIDASLQKKFEYVREDPAATEAAYLAAQPEAAAKAPQGGSLTAQAAVEFQRQRHIDILILGNFVFDPDAQEILVTTFISTGAKDRFRELPLRRNKVNATIFGLADKVADDIVEELLQFTQEQAEESIQPPQQQQAANQKFELFKPQQQEAPPITAESYLYLEPGISLLQAPSTSGRDLTAANRYPFENFNYGVSLSLLYQSTLPSWKIFNFMRSTSYMLGLEYGSYSANFQIVGSAGEVLRENDAMKLQNFGLSFSLVYNFSLWKIRFMPFVGGGANYAVMKTADEKIILDGLIPKAQVGCRIIVYEWKDFDIGMNWHSLYNFLNEGNNHLDHIFALSGGYRL